MNKKKAKLIFKHNYFEIVEEGDYVLCAMSGKKILLNNLNYWNVDFKKHIFHLKRQMKDLKTLKNKFFLFPSIMSPYPLIRIF